MRVLVTNDDGISSAGLHALARAFADHGDDVVVVAPADERSGAGAAIGTLVPGEGVAVERVVGVAGLEGLEAWAVDAPPAFCVLLSLRLGVFGPAPDMVVAGINPGYNTGRSVLHSGTVGAALTAANSGWRALAVSLGMPDEPADRGQTGEPATPGVYHWGTAGRLAVAAAGWLEDEVPGRVLNLNVPNRPLEAVRGVRCAPLARLGAATTRVTGIEPDGTVGLELGPPPLLADPGTDTALVADGWCTLTPLVPPREGPPAVGADIAVAAVLPGNGKVSEG
jgi:5'-nucleotidase